MIRTENLHVFRGGIQILKDINLEINKGEIVLITGPSGCGKSTLALALSGLLPLSIPARITGHVKICGLDTQSHPIQEIVQHAGLVLQNPSSQLFHLRVEDEIAFGPRNLGLSDDEIQLRTDWAIKATGLEQLRGEKPSTLSGGQKQCVAIASILAMRPQVLILDEPTASLDVPNTRRVLETLETLRDECGVTIVLIEHRLADVAKMASRMILMNQGQIVMDNKPDLILSDMEIRSLYGFRRMPNESQRNWEALIKIDERVKNGRKPLLTLDNISAGYNRKNVIRNINFSIYPGDFIALVGNNGAGKSTLGMVAAGLIKPQSGNLRFQNGLKPQPGLDVSMLFQNPVDQLFTDSVNDEVAFGPHNYNCFNQDQHEEILQETDLQGFRKHKPLMLSAGQGQRTALGACLGLRPKLLILDEPTLGQDWWHLQKLMDFLHNLNKQGMAILLISHDFKIVHRYARRVYLMKNGQIQLTGKSEVRYTNHKFPVHSNIEGEVNEVNYA